MLKQKTKKESTVGGSEEMKDEDLIAVEQEQAALARLTHIEDEENILEDDYRA